LETWLKLALVGIWVRCCQSQLSALGIHVRIKARIFLLITLTMKITSKGQVTIPVEIREKLGFLPNTDVEFEVVPDALYLKKVAIEAKRGKNLIAIMQGKATVKMTT